MVFSSPLFLFAFLPVTLLAYFLSPKGGRNGILLAASLLFYLVGGGPYILLLLFSIVGNFLTGLWIERSDREKRKLPLTVGILINLAPLIVFKYLGFGASCIEGLAAIFGNKLSLHLGEIFLPAGVSFFTFQGLAYLIDIHRGHTSACTSLTEFALFKSFFPQLVAGPIVRYPTLAKALTERQNNAELSLEGATRFGFGLAKKVVLADTLGRVADSVFSLAPGTHETPVAWIGIAAYTLQIFFDFSGYSDMAIGLGLIFGLRLPENFNQPYSSTSVTEFWQRWHMSLSTWFRDYVYIPLGGNRKGTARTLSNLVIVFLLCGLWHGAAFTFIIWGAYHGALLLIERLFKVLFNFEVKGFVGRIYTILAVMLGWVIFRSPNLSFFSAFTKSLVGFGAPSDASIFGPNYYLTNNVIALGLVGLLLSLLPLPLWSILSKNPKLSLVRPFVAFVCTALAVITQAPQSFNPFIYFQF